MKRLNFGIIWDRRTESMYTTDDFGNLIPCWHIPLATMLN